MLSNAGVNSRPDCEPRKHVRQCSPDTIRILSGNPRDRISALGRISQTIRIVSTDIRTEVVKLKLFLNINPNPNNQANQGQSQYHCCHTSPPLTSPSLINIVVS